MNRSRDNKALNASVQLTSWSLLKVTKYYAQRRNYGILQVTKHAIKGGFFETLEVGIIGIFILLKYENALELVTSDISFN